MARNEEKAQSLLNRWTSMKQDFADTFQNRRPYHTSMCDNLAAAERWRRQIIREISKKVTDIQNAGLGEHVIRDLNDDINKRMKEKFAWEKRVHELGGPDYTKSGGQMFDDDGVAVQGTRGYKYFGAAKNLPGVRELFETPAPPPKKRTKKQLSKHITPEYYGFDEDDEDLLQEEERVQNERQQALLKEWEQKQSVAA